MSTPGIRFTIAAAAAVIGAAALCGCRSWSADAPMRSDLLRALTFHASFDESAEADFALGDSRIYTAPALDKRREGQPGLNARDVVLAPGEGRWGGALLFLKKSRETVFYQAASNVNYPPENFSGTVSFWLKLDPEKDLEPGYCDPVQITPRDWNDAAFFVDFSKDEKPRHFRLGVFSDLKVWNPTGRDWDSIPPAERPMVVEEKHPFGGDHWTHVAFTFSGFNTGAPATARLYLAGRLVGALSGRPQTFTWDPTQTLILLGLSYVGLFDDLAVFSRELSAEEVRLLGRLEGGVKALR